MKFILATVLAMFTVGSFAQEDFNAKKQQKLNHIDEKIQLMQESRSCIQNASDKDALKACKEEMKAQKEEAKEEYKKQKEEWKDKKEKQEEKLSE